MNGSLPATDHHRADRGLCADGTIAREGALDRVPPAFVPLVAAARTAITGAYGEPSSGAPGDPAGPVLHSAYLYGSVPRGTARPGASDLDLLIALHREPTSADRATARAVEGDLDGRFGVVDGVGILLFAAEALLSELERHDLGFFVACLCTPLLGEDLGTRLPRYRPTALLARETNGDLALLLPQWRHRADAAGTADERRRLCRGVARRLVRTGFTLVMPDWGGWTSDLRRSAELCAARYPARAGQLRLAADAALAPSADPAVLEMLIGDLAPWLAAEYTAVHGPKAPRP
ncbi:nucleotidyltransferase domain-containing protein [Kitasatospora sp. NPDC059571]|uniref:nucleotidyltransferase domain-containing protein n=1 Tax=Kitasatospora sp. NPDC059571 TaxID=3346871 RepID=UPI0036CCE499